MATSFRVTQTRLKSSFIYLANAVNDLRGNWTTLGLVVAPIVVLASLCLLPDALNVQHQVAVRFAPGTRSIGYFSAQVPYAPAVEAVKPLFPNWVLMLFHIVLALLTICGNLLLLCAIRRFQTGAHHPRVLNEAIEVYREAFRLLPAFFWIVLLQLGCEAAGLILLIVPGLLLIIWLYFAKYALVFDNHHSWRALLHSRDLMRRRFFKVATRIIVFLAVWSGYNAWVGGAFLAVSLFLGPIGLFAGLLLTMVFLLDLIGTGVGFATSAFFIAASVRLYQDLTQMAAETAAQAAAEPATAPLPSVSA